MWLKKLKQSVSFLLVKSCGRLVGLRRTLPQSPTQLEITALGVVGASGISLAEILKSSDIEVLADIKRKIAYLVLNPAELTHHRPLRRKYCWNAHPAHPTSGPNYPEP